MYYMCVCERHKHSDKAVIPALKLHKSRPCLHRLASTQEGDKQKKWPISSTKRKENICLAAVFTVSLLFSFLLKRGKYRGGKIIMGGENGKKLEEREEAQALPSLEMLSK